MADKNTDAVKDLTGLSAVPPEERAGVEKDLLTTLLQMAEENTSPKDALPIEIKRQGTVRFSFRVHPVSDDDVRTARKAAITYMPNPSNKKLPKIEKDRDEVQYRSVLIYNATVPEDREKVWNNQVVKERFGAVQGYETIDKILNVGEKMKVFEKILEFSGLNEEDEEAATPEDYAKN